MFGNSGAYFEFRILFQDTYYDSNDMSIRYKIRAQIINISRWKYQFIDLDCNANVFAIFKYDYK